MFYVCVNNMKNNKLVKLGGYLWGWITENLILKICILLCLNYFQQIHFLYRGKAAF